MRDFIEGCLLGLVALLLFEATGCNGFFKWDGPGLLIKLDGQAHYLKIGDPK